MYGLFYYKKDRKELVMANITNNSLIQAEDTIIQVKNTPIQETEEFRLLLAAMTKGGKTTIATALCDKKSRGKMIGLNNCRTETTVDWTYLADTTDITLKEIILNYKGVFGTDQKERISYKNFCEILDSEDGKYLTNVFGIEKPENHLISPEELENHVLEHIRKYIDNCDDQGLSKLIKDRKSNRFLRRIKVTVPPVERFRRYFKEKNISLVLRDTRGLLDIDPEEATKLHSRTMQELGLDNINAVLLLGTSAPFADTVSWYKNAYKSAFESVPVFIMTRPDSISTIFDITYGIDNEGVTEENVKDFLKAAKKGTEKGFRELPNCYLQCYRLLEMFEIGKLNGNEFTYNYKVYKNEDLRYVYPNSTTLVNLNNEKPDYDCPDYKLYEMIVFENLNDMLNKIIEHNGFVKAINSQIKADFVAFLKINTYIEMRPLYKKYTRNDVCNSITTGDILGPRDGIVTTDHGQIIYLGAVTSAVSSRLWIRGLIYLYKYSGTLTNADGTPLIKDMPEDCQNNLIRMSLFKLVEDRTDHNAYFHNYYFIDRYIVQYAITQLRNSKNVVNDSLNSVSHIIANYILR